MGYLEAFIWFHVSFIVRMLIIFSLMMWYYNWVDKERKLWKVTKFIWYPAAWAFAIADVVYNWYSWIIFKDKPASWKETVTYRMIRYLKTEKRDTWLSKWRYYFAVVICTVTGWTDPGHCGDANAN